MLAETEVGAGYTDRSIIPDMTIARHSMRPRATPDFSSVPENRLWCFHTQAAVASHISIKSVCYSSVKGVLLVGTKRDV